MYLFQNMDVAKATERLLKLAVSYLTLFFSGVTMFVFFVTPTYLLLLQIPNHLVWLIFFYLMFHSFLNLIGEMLHFADRNFYCDWWNANNIDTFWRSWNMPVHRWALR